MSLSHEATPMIDLSRYADREHLLLASYAMHSRDTAGRIHDEYGHSYRGPFSRDRDRILHSSAFRRLAGKMQVFTGEMGVYHRTRLTHTFEVASVARTIARVLRLNEDLTEALALMHDIGHPPYGHCGEDVLAECLEDVGGFSHNQFALTIVEELEQRYQDFAGLNLCRETLAGQDVRAHKAEAAVGRAPLLEVQIVDLADSIAYDAHDVDDALQMGLLTIEELSELAIVRRSLDRIADAGSQIQRKYVRQSLVHELIDLQVSDLLHGALERLRPLSGYRAEDISSEGIRVHHSDVIARERSELESFLFDAVYRHPRLMDVRRSAGDRLRRLFDTLLASPGRLPLRFRERCEHHSVPRVIGEYLAGMTDTFCDAQYRHICQNDDGPLADW
ncbi:dGTP triphosphohydrolase [Crateriforma conspicua]|uniref:Deoxyguanosinetriphosphate triphosphohydrolase-like protein n=1 Tax=Crateriforma conspicua TaxID=2527996 RepID=A0A5C5Y948_9PLAN|nr:dNTP triphosphohydrolase [Crateriforma conspicua]QDV62116.1 Deoxyguanosinetriphosphate triphosphohydrolase [Crateriforma conspicua]TWT71714.1 Deoxyguanosinetriphosphate triphosphohydrolase [Crateriforma conspicua]